MSFGDCCYEAIISLRQNFLRTFLTVLGIVIGVMSVIVMLAVGKGVQNQVTSTIESIGSNLLVIFPKRQTSNNVKMPGVGSVNLTLEDAKELGFAEGVDGVASVIAKTLQIQYLEANTSARVSGVTPEYNELREWNLLYGNYLSEQDIKRSSRVAVVGLTVAKELFGRTDVEGKIIRIKNVPFRISGVLAEKGSSITGRDQDNTILVPITTARKYLIKSKYPRSVSYIILKVKEEVDIERVQKNLELLLRVAHRLRDDEKNDFSISNLADISSTAETATEALRILLASIAGISLLVGGVGIMNIMLVNVTERTREIGIRLAIGASREDILRQFLIESALVCLTGGCLGILFGIFVSFLIATFTPVFVQVSMASILLSFFISIGIGVFFGWYPARKASLMEPVVALRTD